MKKFLPVFLLLGIVCSSFFTGKVLAAGGPIPSISLPCDQTANPEFNSLRPYQTSICGGANKARFCSNTLEFTESFSDFPNCNRPNGPQGSWICQGVNRHIDSHDITVNLANSQLPILGNTELTQNSQNLTEQIDSATQMSEYVSSYLEGVNNKAEYGTTKNTNDDIINFSGPIQKIMPQAILEAQRIAVIASASATTTYSPENDEDPNVSLPIAKTLESHNQIAVCYTKSGPHIPYWITNFFGLPAVGLGSETPIDCYKGGGSGTQGSYLRLLNWQTDPVLQSIDNGVRGYLSKLFSGNILSQVLASAFINRWDKNIPPLPWSDENGKPFASSTDYQKAYNEWRGQFCAYINLPFIGNNLFCAGVPGLTNNVYSDLFPYIPLASTPDKHGTEVDVQDAVEFFPEGGTEIANQTSKQVKAAPLFFSHSQEDMDLSNFLNSSYVPKGVIGAPEPKTTAANSEQICSIVDVRANPTGDNLFPGATHGVVGVGVEYTITAVPCVTTLVHRDAGCGNSDKGGRNCWPASDTYSTHCDAEINLKMPTITKSPNVDQIWASTVSDSESTFRKIYPEVGAGAPVSCIEDNPGKTGVSYTGIDPIGGGTANFKVTGPGGGDTTSNSSLYFPHIGSIYDYFLKGIQQALRPEGYGEGTPQSGQTCFNVACGELPTGLPKAAGSCSLGNPPFNVPQSLRNIISAAAQTYNVPPSLILGVMYGEGAFNTDAAGHFTKYDWTDPNVKNWATCQPIPYCDANASSINSIVPFDSGIWSNLATKILPDLKKVDPTKTQADPCNLIDATYGLAKDLHDDAGGYGAAGQSCFGITMSNTDPTTCAWNNSQYETSIKEWETGGNPTCYTTLGSCAKGNSIPPCSINSSDPNCDSLQSHSTDPGVNSHNACVFDIATGTGGNGNNK